MPAGAEHRGAGHTALLGSPGASSPSAVPGDTAEQRGIEELYFLHPDITSHWHEAFSTEKLEQGADPDPCHCLAVQKDSSQHHQLLQCRPEGRACLLGEKELCMSVWPFGPNISLILSHISQGIPPGWP